MFVTSCPNPPLPGTSLTTRQATVSFAHEAARERLLGRSTFMSVEAHSADVDTLHRMDYAQELLRRMSGFSNFAVSFTIISILSGCLTLFYFGMSNGGPAIINIGWPLVGVMVILVGPAMAEGCSSYPTAGGLYYWAAKLGGKSKARWGWVTGWFNPLGPAPATCGAGLP